MQTRGKIKMTIDEKLKKGLGNRNPAIIRSEKMILKLMKFRNTLGFSQNFLAKKSGVSRTSIARIEDLSMQPTLKTFLQILDVYNMTIDIVPKTKYQKKEVELKKGKKQETVKQEKITYNEVIKFIKDKIPLNMHYSEDYSKFINDIFKNYNEFLEKNNADIETKDIVNRFGRYCHIILSEYYNGQHQAAYFLFKEALESCTDIEPFLQSIPNDTIFYRYRNKKNIKCQEQDFYHIPFSMRYAVSTQRYSFPGLPCLYLGSSKKVCLLESKTELKNIAIASINYTSKKNNKIFDLTNIFLKIINNQDSLCTSEWLRCIPLYLICSTYIDYEKLNVSFKQEYIFPQLLLEYIINESTLSENSVIGLKYFSVHTDIWKAILDKNEKYLNTICNYVFPATNKKDGSNYCERLNKDFKVVNIS